jgi:hypothetical protein
MKVFDCNGDGLLTDLDYCVRFIDNWQWKGTSFDTRNVVLVRCWVSNTAYRHLIVLTVWTGTEMDWIVVDPLYRVAPENYVSYTDITEQWQYWFWGGA